MPNSRTSIKEARERPALDEEVPFSFDEVFFSRTDKSGIIRSGNEVFQRISRYSWLELIGKPHKIVRHPEMPKAVFWLLWDQIKKGNPIGAYVKNRAKDGRYYWVFAIVTPIDSGFLSVRFKPSEMLPLVAAEYKQLSELAAAQSLSAEESATILLKRIETLGFADYQAFMSCAIASEIMKRNAALGRQDDGLLIKLDEIARCAKELAEQSKTIFDSFAENRYVPLNLAIKAAQLGSSGAAIAVIARNFDSISGDIRQCMNRFSSSAEEVLSAAYRGLFLAGTAVIQRELFEREVASGAAAHSDDLPILAMQERDYRSRATDSLLRIARQNAIFQAEAAEMKSLMSGLAVTRVMGRIEGSRLGEAGIGLDPLMDSLGAFQDALGHGLSEIEHRTQDIQRRAVGDAASARRGSHNHEAPLLM